MWMFAILLIFNVSISPPHVQVNALKKADEARKAQLAKEEERKARKAKVEKIMQMRMQERQMDVARLEMVCKP